MDWVQFLTTIGSFLAVFAFLYKELRDWRSETREESKFIREEIQEIRHGLAQQADRTDRQAERTDRLYEMFIELVKQTKKC